MPDGFYRDLPDVLSQGDIVADIPWGLVEAPTTLCRPINRASENGNANYWRVEPWGGHAKSPKPWTHDPEIIHAIGWQGVGIVLWHDCQIDKAENQQTTRPEKAFAAVAPVLPLDKLQGEVSDETTALRKGVRNNEHHSYFYLPSTTLGEFVLPESFVNLRYIWSVRQATLLPKRKFSLATEYRLSMYESLFVFFTRFRLDVEPMCPRCGIAVPLAMSSDPDEGVA